MGNRAVITASLSNDPQTSNDIGIYLHWNGGRDSVEAFLEYCKRRGFRPPDQDNYGWARLCQVIANYFGGDLSIGVDLCRNLDCDNYDNGVYVIHGWDIIGRHYFEREEQRVYNLEEMVYEIVQAQPEKDRLYKDGSGEGGELGRDIRTTEKCGGLTAAYRRGRTSAGEFAAQS